MQTNKIKTYTIILKAIAFAVALLAIESTSCGQVYQVGVNPLSQTNTALGNLDGANTNAVVTTASATNYYITIPACDRFGDVCMQVSFRLLSGAATDVCKTVFDASADGTNWIPSWAVISTAANGTTTVSGLTNITLNSIGFLRLAYFTNATAVSVTNLMINACYKPLRYGR